MTYDIYFLKIIVGQSFSLHHYLLNMSLYGALPHLVLFVVINNTFHEVLSCV
jgi:hypothetical protein